ncbi:MAG: hypothetical protein JWP84_4459, partial [Tardiphaga sp.]|nr:hypothetical protein [Tardiphaga sp.]
MAPASSIPRRVLATDPSGNLNRLEKPVESPLYRCDRPDRKSPPLRIVRRLILIVLLLLLVP